MTRGGRKLLQLIGSADDFGVGDSGGQHGADKVREGTDAIHEDPEPGHGFRGSQDTAEDQAQTEEQVGDVAACFGRLKTSNDEISEGGGEQHEGDQEQEHESATLGSLAGGGSVCIKPDGVVPGDEHQSGHEGVPGELNNDLREHKDLPAVDFGGTLADLIQGALDDEVRHSLLYELAEDGENVEDGKHLVLETLDGVGSFEKNEADEERDDEAENGLGVNVGGSAPVLLEDTMGDTAELLAEGSSELTITSIVGGEGIRGLGLGLETLKLFLDGSILGTLAPGLVPVDIGNTSRGSTDNLQHPLSGVGVSRAREATIALKVGSHGLGVFADIAKVHSPATLGQKQESVEALEEHGRGLMNGAENGLSALGELLEKIQNGPRCLTVETGGRLINEEEQRGLGSKFDTDSKTLALFNVETFARDTDDGVSVFLHFQKLDNLINISELLFAGDVRGLTKESAKVQGLANGGSLKMKILLLNVAGLALERSVSGKAINKHFSRDNTHGGSVSQAVEKSGLASAGDAHESRESTGLHPSVHIVQDLASLLLDLDLVADVVPMENTSRALDVATLLIGLVPSSRLGNRSSNSDTARFGITLVLLEGRRLVAATEEQDLTLALGSRDCLSRKHVGGGEEGDEGEQDTKVAPLMRHVVLESRVDVVVAIDNR